MLLAVDTNFLMDLARGLEMAFDALEIVRERVDGCTLVVGSTVLGELDNCVEKGAMEERRLAGVAINPKTAIGGSGGMGDSPMWVVWHGRLARDSRGQTGAPSKHMGESPMPLDSNQFHGRVARATQPNRAFRD